MNFFICSSILYGGGWSVVLIRDGRPGARVGYTMEHGGTTASGRSAGMMRDRKRTTEDN